MSTSLEAKKTKPRLVVAETESATTAAATATTLSDRLSSRSVKTVLALFDQAIVSGGNFVTTMILVRSAGFDGLGAYSLAFTIGVFLMAIQESLIVLPYTVYGNRLTGVARTRCAGSALLQQLVLAALATAFLAIIALGLGRIPEIHFAKELGVLAIWTPFLLLREFARRMSFADLRMMAVLAVDSVVTVLLLGSLTALAWQGELTAARALACWGGASAVGAIAWLCFSRKKFAFDRDSVVAEVRRNVALGGWACLSRITNVAEGYTVHWLLAILVGTVATGAFAACMTVVNLSNPILMGVGAVLAPYAAQAYAQHGKEGLRALIRRANGWLIPPTILFALIMFLFGDHLLALIYKDGAADFGLLVGLLSLSVLASTMGMAADNALRAMERTRLNFVASLCGVGASTPIALLTIPYVGPLGAAIGLTVGGFIAAGVRIMAVRRMLESEA